MKPIVVCKDGMHQAKYGCFRFNDMVGMEYGERVRACRAPCACSCHADTHAFFCCVCGAL